MPIAREAVTDMLGHLGIVVVAIALLTTALSLPASAKEGSMTPAVSSAASQDAKRIRKPPVRRLAAAGPVAARVPYHQQCFLFFCGDGRTYPWLVLGVGY